MDTSFGVLYPCCIHVGHLTRLWNFCTRLSRVESNTLSKNKRAVMLWIVIVHLKMNKYPLLLICILISKHPLIVMDLLYYPLLFLIRYIFNNRKMICLQQFYNIFTTNPKWQVVTGCYCWVKKVISMLNSNLNQ